MRRIREPAELYKAATKHVHHEIKMLIHSAMQLGGRYSSPQSTLEDNQKNMALESFLLHFRNLRAFLCPGLQGVVAKPDDILASDFLREPEQRDIGNADKLAPPGEKDRLDRMLAHLTYHRDQYIEAGQDDWPSAQMAADALAEFDTFLACLKPEMASWFPARPELKQHQSHLADIAQAAALARATAKGMKTC